MVPYIGNAPYCYANATAMLLTGHGWHIDPATIECLTGVGIGARWFTDAHEIYFSSVPPDVGVTRALELLGFGVDERCGAKGEPAPWDALGAALKTGPVVLGPLDLGHLSYTPNAANLHGADHYVVLTELSDNEARVHDPYGYANVRITREDLGQAWEAEAIAYRREPYRFWFQPERRESPSEETLRQCLVGAMRRTYAELETAPHDNDLLSGDEAYEAATDWLRKGESDGLMGLLKVFGLPLGARRALDLSMFLTPADAELGEIKRRQSAVFIDGYRAVLDGDRDSAAEAVLAVGALDAAFRARLGAM